ncbi:hypothetical protein [Enterovibrio norvegicus]|uniref:hypothetical protein n=1 Tax=Enterovibrio norvegicus TaxID=188144 RepID=UPI000C8553BB|nr:hypothetical protein [Enterovibrio norvegicus]PMH64438.1 hypothetical protein BCU62_15400 [Enterovibrio norvegicus]
MLRNRTLPKRQRGANILSVSLGLIALIVVGLMLARAVQTYKHEQVALVTEKRIEYVHKAMQRAYLNAVTGGLSPSDLAAYPANSAALLATGHIPPCDDISELAGLCLNQLKLPWVDIANVDEQIDIQTFADPSDNYPAYSLTFSVTGINPIKLRNIVVSRLSQLPGFANDGAGGITLTFTRPGTAINYENLVKKDGSEPMTDDWDYGGFYLDNVKDISFSEMTDRTAITGTVKIGSAFIPDNTGISIDKHTCPDGYVAEIEPWVVGMGGSDAVDLGYNFRSFSTWPQDNGSSWQLYFRALGEDSSGNPRFYYEGAIAYATWCDFL